MLITSSTFDTEIIVNTRVTLTSGNADDVPGDSRLRPHGHRPGGVLPEIDYQPDAVTFKQTGR